jgi:hypothetical protein
MFKAKIIFSYEKNINCGLGLMSDTFQIQEEAERKGEKPLLYFKSTNMTVISCFSKRLSNIVKLNN